jgi:hypothetical protein
MDTGSKNLKVLTRFFNSFKNDLPPPGKRLNWSMVNAGGYANSYTQALVKVYVHLLFNEAACYI